MKKMKIFEFFFFENRNRHFQFPRRVYNNFYSKILNSHVYSEYREFSRVVKIENFEANDFICAMNFQKKINEINIPFEFFPRNSQNFIHFNFHRFMMI